MTPLSSPPLMEVRECECISIQCLSFGISGALSFPAFVASNTHKNTRVHKTTASKTLKNKYQIRVCSAQSDFGLFSSAKTQKTCKDTFAHLPVLSVATAKTQTHAFNHIYKKHTHTQQVFSAFQPLGRPKPARGGPNPPKERQRTATGAPWEPKGIPKGAKAT